MATYKEEWTWTEEFNVPGWREGWDLKPQDIVIKPIKWTLTKDFGVQRYREEWELSPEKSFRIEEEKKNS